MIVIDTNILAYLLISGDRTEDAKALFELDRDWRSEPFVIIELTNILATYCRTRDMRISTAERILANGERVVRNLARIPHVLALRMAGRFAVTAYDARFLAAAESLGTKLVTEDAKLRVTVPSLTLSMSEALHRQ